MSTLQHLAIVAHVHAGSLKSRIIRFLEHNPGVLMILFGVAVVALPDVVMAKGLSSQLDDWSSTVKDIVNFIMTVAVLIGVGGILYGCKLIMDKANDRADVKTGSIVVSFVGGAFLCILWFIVTMLSETAGDGTVGETANF